MMNMEHTAGAWSLHNGGFQVTSTGLRGVGRGGRGWEGLEDELFMTGSVTCAIDNIKIPLLLCYSEACKY